MKAIVQRNFQLLRGMIQRVLFTNYKVVYSASVGNSQEKQGNFDPGYK